MAGKRVCALDDPVHVLSDMIEELFSVSGFEIPENLSDVREAYGPRIIGSRGRHCSSLPDACGVPLRTDHAGTVSPIFRFPAGLWRELPAKPAPRGDLASENASGPKMHLRKYRVMPLGIRCSEIDRRLLCLARAQRRATRTIIAAATGEARREVHGNSCGSPHS